MKRNSLEVSAHTPMYNPNWLPLKISTRVEIFRCTTRILYFITLVSQTQLNYKGLVHSLPRYSTQRSQLDSTQHIYIVCTVQLQAYVHTDIRRLNVISLLSHICNLYLIKEDQKM